MSDISKMNDRQLRNEVQLLRDELAIMNRKYEDIIYNLDTDNFSSRFVKEQGDMKTAIKITAEGIESKVSKEEMETFKESTITQTATMIRTEVKALQDNDDELYTQIVQTSDSIKSVVSKNISVKFVSDYYPTYSNTTNKEKGMLCEYEGELYYYNDISETWKIYPYANGIKSQFLQTASGFELTGDVSISGDAIVGGVISGASLQNNLQSAVLYLGEESGSWADLNLEDRSGNKVFTVYQDASIVHYMTYGDTFLSTTGNTTYPQGNWDFSECDCNIVAKFG